MGIDDLKQLLIDVKMRSEDDPDTTTKDIMSLIKGRLSEKAGVLNKTKKF